MTQFAVFLTRVGVDRSFGGWYAGLYKDVIGEYGAYYVPIPCRVVDNPLLIERYSYESIVSRGRWGDVTVPGSITNATRRFLDTYGWRLRLGNRVYAASSLLPHLDPLIEGGYGAYGANVFERRCLEVLLGTGYRVAIVFLTTLEHSSYTAMYAIGVLWVENRYRIDTRLALQGLSPSEVVEASKVDDWARRLVSNHVHVLRVLAGSKPRIEHIYVGHALLLRRPLPLIEWRVGGKIHQWLRSELEEKGVDLGVLASFRIERLGYFHAVMGTQCSSRQGIARGATVLAGDLGRELLRILLSKSAT